MVNRGILVINFIIMLLLIFGVLSMMFFLPMIVGVSSGVFVMGLFLVLILFGLYSSIMQLRNKDQNKPKRSFFDKLLLYSPFINIAIILGVYFLLSSLG